VPLNPNQSINQPTDYWKASCYMYRPIHSRWIWRGHFDYHRIRLFQRGSSFLNIGFLVSFDAFVFAVMSVLCRRQYKQITASDQNLPAVLCLVNYSGKYTLFCCSAVHSYTYILSRCIVVYFADFSTRIGTVSNRHCFSPLCGFSCFKMIELCNHTCSLVWNRLIQRKLTEYTIINRSNH